MRRILKILVGAKAKQRVHSDALQVTDRGRQLVFALDGVDAVKFRLQRFQALGINGLLIHAGSVEVADLLFLCGMLRLLGGIFLQDLVQHGAIALVQFGEAPIAGLVGGNLSVRQPVAAGILIKILAGVGSLIHGIDVEALRYLGLLRRRRLFGWRR